MTTKQEIISNKPFFEINDYIGQFDGYLTDSMCDEMINIFKKRQEWHDTYDRLSTENIGTHIKDDEACTINEFSFEASSSSVVNVLNNFSTCLNIYFRKTNILNYLGLNDLYYLPLKIQKTLPTQGFHGWHIEQSRKNNKYMEVWGRMLVYTIYLNDVEEGGETEFLIQKRRIKAKKGRICIFPAHFPYIHRGNPPLSGEKYILTSWLTCMK